MGRSCCEDLFVVTFCLVVLASIPLDTSRYHFCCQRVGLNNVCPSPLGPTCENWVAMCLDFVAHLLACCQLLKTFSAEMGVSHFLACETYIQRIASCFQTFSAGLDTWLFTNKWLLTCSGFLNTHVAWACIQRWSSCLKTFSAGFPFRLEPCVLVRVGQQLTDCSGTARYLLA